METTNKKTIKAFEEFEFNNETYFVTEVKARTIYARKKNKITGNLNNTIDRFNKKNLLEIL